MLRSLSAKVILGIVFMEVLGGLGAFLTSDSIASWYSNLVRPPGTPPNGIFGPVWSTLYAMIGISLALIWHQGGLGKNQLTLFFFIQLVLNLIWTPVFFGAHLMIPALVVIVLMWLFIALTIRDLSKVSKPAASLLVPYFLWVGYATYLNAGFAYLN